ncbi:Sin3 associated polypeptide p18 [Xylariales sp. AK1849]|nr:Sin3 associated polypeptide p18 [Xylariales sp. AK1849]
MDRRANPPFALRLFYRTGAFHRPDEFTTSNLPPNLIIHTWPDCTLTELSHHLASSPSSNTPILPTPAIGTRLSFRLVFHDTRGAAPRPGPHPHNSSSSRFMAKDLGSVVIGDGGPGLDPSDIHATKERESTDADKTLAEARFVVGDYISVAILPPLGDGSVAPAGHARMGRGAGAGEAGAISERVPERLNAGRENGSAGRGWIRGRGGPRGRHDDFGRGGGGGNLPAGEWRRGERLPDGPLASAGRGGRGFPPGEWRRGDNLSDGPPFGRGRGRGRF